MKWVAALLTPQQSQEALARAYIHAIAGRAGFTCSVREFDYGIDLTLHQVTVRTDPATGRKRYYESGTPLDVQLKSTTNAVASDIEVQYDLGVDAYDDLRKIDVCAPRILVLHVQPKGEHERLKLTQEGLILGGHCYWMSLRGYPAVPNVARVRVRFPRSNVLSEQSLREIMKRVGSRELF